MRMTLGTQLGVVTSTSRVANDTDTRPVVESIAKAFVAAMAHEHHGLLTALPCDGSRAGVAPQPVIISICDSLRGFAEHRGGDDSSNSRQGKKDFRVTMLFCFTLPGSG